MRKLITTGLIAVLAIVMGAASVQAQNPTSGDFGSLKWKYDTGTKTLTISGQGKMPDGRSNVPWYGYWREIKNLVIEEGVADIKRDLFSWYPDLSSATIPASVKKIGPKAFGACTKLQAITLAPGNTEYMVNDGVLFTKDKTVLVQYPAGRPGTTYAIPTSVKKIEASAFDYSLNLASVTIPKSVKTIGDYAFLNCGALTSIAISADVETIGHQAFSSCWNLTEIKVDDKNNHYTTVDGVLFNKEKTILLQYPAGRPETTYTTPEGVEEIGASAFEHNHYLNSVIFSASVTSIGQWAFRYSNALKSVNISAGVKTIEKNIFVSCHSLTQITVDEGNKYYASIGGVLFNKAKTTLLEYPAGRTETEYTIPTGVNAIGENALSSCSKLNSVKFPESVKQIGFGAFQNSGLTSVTLPIGVTEIEFALFAGCRELTSITLPAGITKIGDVSFHNCEKLKDVTARMQTPPNIQVKDVFREVTLSDVTLTVPKGTTEAYKAAGWTGFKEYKEAASTFDVQPANFDLDYSWNEKIIEVTSDRPWKATLEGNVAAEFVVDDSNPNDVKSAPEITGSGNRAIRLWVLPNDSFQRVGKIIVETTDAGTPAKKEITIKQKGWYGVKIGDVGLTSENYNDITAAKGFTAVKSGTVTYDKDENVLTLENAEIESWRIGVYFSQGGTIVLKGNNKITATQESVPAIAQNRVVPLRIKGDGSLTVSANLNHGISGVGDVIIEGGCSVEVMPSIRTNNGKVIIDDAELYVKSRADFYSTIIAAKGIELKGGVKVLEPKAAEIKQYDAEYDSQGNWYKFYSFLQGNTPCKEIRIGREVKLEAKAVKDDPVSIDGGEKQINVTSDAKWKVTVPAEAAAWVEVKGKTAGTNPNDSLVTLTVKPNLTLGTPREATILFETVAEKGLPTKQEVKITQEGSNFLAHWVSIYDTTLHFTAKKDTLKMKITSNTAWEISVPNPGEWLRIVKDGAANGDFKLEGKLAAKDTVIKFITIANNDEYGFREAKITIKTKDGRFTQEFIAVQDGKFRIKLPEKKTLDLDHVPANKETVQTFEIRSEEPWTLDISALTNLRTKYLFNGLPWLTVETSPLTGGGAHDSIVKVTIAANTAVAARGAKLEFMNANGTSMGKFNLKQDASTPAPTPSTPSTPSNQGTTRPTTPVIVSITGITLDKTEIVVDGNAKSLWLTTIISPTDATNKVIKWTSSDSAVASVSDRGLVTIHKKGKAVITATTTDGSGKSATCSILVRSTVSNVTLPEARIYAAGGRLYLTLQTAAPVGIYTLNGVLVRTFTAPAGETTVALPQGVYIVRVGERTEKVFVN